MSQGIEELPRGLRERMDSLRDGGRLVVLSGAGISAESGIPTFRGREGYWVVGAREYQPQELATMAMFRRVPEEVWSWYLYRRTVCRAAAPNDGHRAVVELERALGERFRLITQNVDGLHLRAGSSLERSYQIHGNIDFARCLEPPNSGVWPLPEDLAPKGRGEPLTKQERAVLHAGSGECPCRGWARPHVLWFDECYDDANFYFTATLDAASRADVLLVVGTSGATSLPVQAGMVAVDSGATIVDVNPQPNPFTQMAERAREGYVLQGPSGRFLPLLVQCLRG